MIEYIRMGIIVKKNSLFRTVISFLICFVIAFTVSSCSNLLEDTEDSQTKVSRSADGSVLPAATLAAPSFKEEGISKNSAIIISFSVAMNPQTFMDALSITDSVGNNLKSYFLEPVWSNGNTLVRIPADENNLIDLRGKKYIDIYVSVSRKCLTQDNQPLQILVDDKYRINETVDGFSPNLVLANATVPQKYFNSLSEKDPVVLIDGEINSENEEKICNTNHINSKLDFYVEGYDYDGGAVSAHIEYRRIYDVSGNEVFDESRHFYKSLETANSTGNFFGEFCLDLSDKELLDGMYKLSVTLADSSNLDSRQSKVYYIIRDTTLAYSTNALMWFETPSFVDTLPVASDIEACRNKVQFNFVQDDVYYISKSGSKKTYKQSCDNFTYLFAWGQKPEELTKPVEIKGNGVFVLPKAFQDYCAFAEDSDVYLQATVIDSVGNKNVITTLIPKQIEFYNYEILETEASDDEEENDSTETGIKKIKLNYSDISTDNSSISKLQDKKIQAAYRVFYGKIEEGMSDEEISLIPLKRNISSAQKNALSFGVSDNSVIEVEDNSKYVVYIQQNYNAYSTVNGQWSGQSFGPLYKVIVDSDVSFVSSNTIAVPEFSVKKESAGPNTGLFNLNVVIKNPQKDVRYVPCFSIDDGENWIYYNSQNSEEFTFVVNNPLRAPLAKNEEWDKPEWQDKDYFDAVADVSSSYSYIAKVKILAVQENYTKESAVQTLEFTEEDDNIPPSQSVDINPHDSMLSFDGHSFKYDSLVVENEGHVKKNFVYYYMPYDETWSDNLNVATEAQIEMLPSGVGQFVSKTWRDSTGAKYSLSPVIPLNGIKDGKYMFFARVTDTYGNYSYITLGKANIGTFKNKLNIQYDFKTRSFISRLKLEQNEKFDRNMINVQVWNDSEFGKWTELYGNQNELQNCDVVESNGRRSLFNQTKKDFYRYENEIAAEKNIKSKYTQEIIPGTFYRFTVQSFNDNSYDEASGRGVNIRYGRPYNENLNKQTIVPLVEGETEYDLYTEETVSNTVYCYAPASENELKNLKVSFFTSTASPRSNKPFIVNVISSKTNLGNDIDEWERRGKLVKTHYYTGIDESDSRFNDNTAMNDMAQVTEKGLIYYVAVVHFADNSSAISNVYTMQGY